MFKKLNKSIISYLGKKYPYWDVSIALRYLPIAKDIRSNFSEKAKLLDVGSGEFGLATYLTEDYDFTGTDLTFGNKRGKIKLVKASAEKLPFKKNSFDAAVSVDMLEHLSPDIRGRAVYEMMRVAREKVYLSFPRGRLAGLADGILSKYYKITHKSSMDYLDEHERNGLPQERSIEHYIKLGGKKLGKRIEMQKRGNTNILLWLFLLLLGFSENKVLTNIYHKLLFAMPFLNLFHFWPTYRVSYFVTFRESHK